MPDTPPDPAPRRLDDRAARRRAVAEAGHTGHEAPARAALADPDGAVRATALGALARLRALTWADLTAAVADPDPAVRVRAAERLADPPTGPDDVDRADPAPARPAPLVPLLLTLLADAEPMVVETTAWACGEAFGAPDLDDDLDPDLDDDPDDDPDPDLEVDPGLDVDTGRPDEADGAGRTPVVARLVVLAREHDDALVREAAVAALGAIGDPAGLPAIVAATADKATVRRRAVIALAPFDGPEVDAALARARDDRDWQVRQAAEDLLAFSPEPDDPDRPDGPATTPTGLD